jgi:mannose-6-phosphate isomerase-like protein (cupin superfamily)
MPDLSTPHHPALVFTSPEGEEERIWFLDSLLTVKATGATTGGAYDLVEELIPPGFSPPPHIHYREEESFYVISGQMTFTCGDQTIAAGPGAFIALPRGVPHTFRVEGTEPARTLMLATPAGLIGFFRELGRLAPGPTLPAPSRPDLAALRRVSEAYGCAIPGLTGH